MRSLENYLNNSSGWPRKLKQNLELALLYQIHYILVFIYEIRKTSSRRWTEYFIKSE